MKKENITIIILTVITLFTVKVSQAQWVQASNGLPNLAAVYSLAYNGNNIFAGSRDSGVYLSTNNGANWTQTTLNNRRVYALAVNGNNIFAGTSQAGIFLSTNNGTSWTQSLNGRYVNAFAINGNNVFAGCTLDGVYRSTNNGSSWSFSGLFNEDILALAASGNNIYAGMYNYYGVYLSTNNGANWTQTSLNNRQVRALAVNINKIFAGTTLAGVYSSINNGATWSQTSLNDKTIWSFAVNGNNVFAGTSGYGVYVSNDNGTTWTQRNEGLGNPYIYALCVLNNYIFAAVGGGVYRRQLVELTGIHTISNDIPTGFHLYQNYPNPFNPITKMKFSIPKFSKEGLQNVKLIIYDVLGNEVATLVNENLNPGTYEVEWDASKYSSGVFYFTLSAGNYKETKKMILLK